MASNAPPKCPHCKKGMEYLGNVSRRVYATNPPTWDAVWICRANRVKAIVREGESVNCAPPPLDLDEYRSIVVE
jgi:hypothetical protein